MGIKNLTEAEEKEFYRLVEKMNGKEPDKKQDVKVKKPIYGQEYFVINSHGWVECDTWQDTAVDNKRWELGNVFLIKEKALFDVEKRRVKVELDRYAKEHNDEKTTDNCHVVMNTGTKEIDISSYWVLQVAGATCFSNREIANDAIEAVGKDRILKYIFGVESEGEE